MNIEKSSEGIIWLESNNVKFRVKKGGTNEVTVWASMGGIDLSTTLVIYDFLNRTKDEINLVLEPDNSWVITGFKVKNEPYRLVVGEMLLFINEWDINVSETSIDRKVIDEIWYSV
ncbi:hypothetical protein [Pseudocolwellia sp. HL-MZ7]|uniref:hypothetical protein n=1 Tax=Pseudocolwellia sp. HL-MZ7 TaxID=3400627 RepID=UPI003CF9C21F